MTSSPHVRGGVSMTTSSNLIFNAVLPTCVGVFLTYTDDITVRKQFSPRAWGCFRLHKDDRGVEKVLPTCVGVFLTLFRLYLNDYSSPHVRGGVSRPRCSADIRNSFSPRAWGCFVEKTGKITIEYVLPTCVGVFPYTSKVCSSPHVRGGVSSRSILYLHVLPTYVGVFLGW